MQQHPFIFSDELKYRIKRHVAFWLFWILFQGLLYAFVGITSSNAFFMRLPVSMLDSFIFIFAHMFLAYCLMYVVIPRFLLKQRYWQTACLTLVVFLLTGLLSAFLGIYVVEPLHARLAYMNYYTGPPNTYDVNMCLALLAGLRGGLTVGGIAATIKLMKYWYVKEQRNLQLQKENIAAQLQLLKAQVHPHFLFNTLNNIYSYTQNTSSKASKLITDLSSMLRFILYECNQPSVALSKELKMIQDYMSLEKVRYGNKLELHVNVPSDTTGLQIAPLLLLPLVENCFKHGTSNMLEQPWISLSVSLKGNQMHMKLLNGKADSPQERKKTSGIGIANVQKRLALLYPGKHELTITNDEDVFILNLKIELEEQIPETIKPRQVVELIHA